MDPEPLPSIVSEVDFSTLHALVNVDVAVTIAILGHPMLALEVIARNNEVAGGNGCFVWVLENALEAAGPARAGEVISRAIELAKTIPDDVQRNLVRIQTATWMAGVEPTNPEAIDRALTLIDPDAIPDGPRADRGRSLRFERQMAMAKICEEIAAAEPTKPESIARADELARIIDDDGIRRYAMAVIARHVVAGDPTNTEAIERATELAKGTRGFTTLPSRSRPRIPPTLP